MSHPPRHFKFMRSITVVGVVALWASVIGGIGGYGPARGLNEPWRAAVDWSLGITEVLRK